MVDHVSQPHFVQKHIDDLDLHPEAVFKKPLPCQETGLRLILFIDKLILAFS